MKAKKMLFHEVYVRAIECGSRYKDRWLCRDDFLEFMDVNDWFGLEVSGTGDQIRISGIESIQEPLDVWLRAYKRSHQEKVTIMLEAYKDRFPDTCRLLNEFIKEKGIEREARTWKLMDYLLSSLEKDITGYDELALQKLIEGSNAILPIVSAELLCEFLSGAGCGEQLFKWKYTFHSRVIVEQDNSAYPIEAFSIMAYCVFNEQAWKDNRLVEKAAESKRYADLWLFCALQFVCALRGTDLKRLPIPQLPLPGIKLRQEILNGRFPGNEAAALVDGLTFRLQMKPLKPSKTAASCEVPELKLLIPESLKVPFGIIMALSLSYREEGDCFVEAKPDLNIIREFFGKAFVAATGGRRFSSIRASKAYLQGIELTSQDETGRTKGYMLAALARSHKGGIGSLSEITDIYLKDVAFSGYKPEFILREMFERGILGFIPALLLEMYAGQRYKALDVSKQTELIRCFGLEPVQIERIAQSISAAMTRASHIVREMLETPGLPLGQTLQNIASGAAPSRHSELLCLRTAASLSCHEPSRSVCIGCGYEVYTKAALHLLMKEYTRLCSLRKSSEELDANRYTMILEQAVMPAVCEMLSSMRTLYPNADMGLLLDIMERGLQDANSN
ncbi:MAG: hypothetical protein LBB91_06435 [Clostridiales bacterium]|jgi:hypothetical protein|nr:hypothetical protein [Clostridiales bacterium]